MKVVIWECHVNDFANRIYDIILGKYLSTELGIGIKVSEYII